MRVSLRQIGILIVLSLIGLQIVPVHRTNPPIHAAEAIYAVEAVPPEVRGMIERSCSDCHSNQTRWPWYAYMAPVSWVVVGDVNQARGKLNFSEWGKYSPKKKAHELEEICNKVLEGEMPESKYAFVHRATYVTEDEREALCAWTDRPHSE